MEESDACRPSGNFLAPKDADEQTLRSAAKQTVQEEGYEPDVELSIRR